MTLLFFDLQRNLLDALRARIRNGELTERGLARLTGVSQPHVHNVLKGTRILSLDLADRILVHLHLSVTDLIQRPAFNQVDSGMEDRPSTLTCGCCRERSVLDISGRG